jgi:eukaryotic-like serine/threonine-protein kinase
LTVAGGVSRIVATQTGSAARFDRMFTCPNCSRQYDDSVEICPIDGETLVFAQSLHDDWDAQPGLIVDGKYKLERKIGRGGMGTVFRAKHIQMDSLVAVKLLRRDLVSNQNAIERFRREALAAARIRHPNAIIVTDFGVTEDHVYLVMEYLEGQDLRKRLRQTKTLSVEEAVRIVVQVCAAVDLAHRRDLIHRDIKPDNILLVSDEETGGEQVKVLDFGIAKLRSSGDLATLTERGAMIGTPYYMSPEQCRGESLDPRSDIYSIGILLYEMLTGVWPFRGDNPFVVGMKHQMEAPRPPRELSPTIPPAIEALILKALEKDPAARPASARELATELLAACEGAGATGEITRRFAGPSDRAADTPDAEITASTVTVGARTEVYPSHPDMTLLDESASPGDAPDTPGTSAASPRPGTPSTPRDEKPGRSRALVYGTAFAAAGALVAAGTLAIPWLNGDTAPPASATVTAPSAPATAVPLRIEVVPRMVYVEGDNFWMGTDLATARPDSRPMHRIFVESYYIDQYEVTNAEYLDFVTATGTPPPTHWKEGKAPPGDENLPVTNVSWTDATRYADWAGKRLPTEREWEFAARGDDGRRYPWGDGWAPSFANHKGAGGTKPNNVGSYPDGVSPFGVFDMASNVAEWTADQYEAYPNSPAKVKTGFRVIRGGAYNAPAEDLVAWNRFYDAPTSRHPNVGFRCAKSP